MKYFATSKAKLRGWWCFSEVVGPYKIVESGNLMFSLVTCDHQSKNSFQNKATWEHFKNMCCIVCYIYASLAITSYPNSILDKLSVDFSKMKKKIYRLLKNSFF